MDLRQLVGVANCAFETRKYVACLTAQPNRMETTFELTIEFGPSKPKVFTRTLVSIEKMENLRNLQSAKIVVMFFWTVDFFCVCSSFLQQNYILSENYTNQTHCNVRTQFPHETPSLHLLSRKAQSATSGARFRPLVVAVQASPRTLCGK